jgi:hypothetical protein
MGDAGDPQSHNAYSYVHNDPVNLVDPTGMCARICATYGFVVTKVSGGKTWYGHTGGLPVDRKTGLPVDTGSASSGSRTTWRAEDGIETIEITARRGSGAYAYSGSAQYRSVSGRAGKRLQRTEGQRLWGDAGARAGIEAALSEAARAVREPDEYRRYREQGSFVVQNEDGTFGHTPPDPYAPYGENYTEGSPFGPAIRIPIPRGAVAIAIALPSIWHHGSIVGGYGAELSGRSEGIGLPIFASTTGRDGGSIYRFEGSGWERLR